MKHQILARLFFVWFFSLVWLFAAIPARAVGNNILVIIADDLGVDMLGIYGRGSDTPPTPNIDALKANGIMFRNAWANPLCSPTRAAIQTGQYGLRTGVGSVSQYSSSGLPLANPSIRPLPRVLNQNPGLGYRHAAIGKWHLSNANSLLTGSNKENAPNDAGWSYFSGNWSAMGTSNIDNWLDDYFLWQKIQNGTKSNIEAQYLGDPAAYVTTVNVNDAIQWVNQQTGPWLLYLAFNSPHSPYHVPPRDLLNPPRDADTSSTRNLYKAMIEAMDTEIGRLIGSLGPSVMSKTTVIFLGDNGTPGRDSDGEAIVVAPFNPDKAKSLPPTLYEGGINVPLIISGADVKKPNRESQALVNATDLYATILDLAGVDLRTALAGAKFDTFSLKPIIDNTYNRSLRKYIYAEHFIGPDAAWTRAVRNDRFKLIRFITHKSEPDSLYLEKFYDLASDPFENDDLLSSTSLTAVQQRNLDDLRAQLDALTETTGTEKWALPHNSWFRNILDFLLD